MDEAASALKIETESSPFELDNKKRKITQLEIELAGLKREKGELAKQKTVEIKSRISELNKDISELDTRWKEQKDIIAKLQNTRKEIDKLKLDLERAEREVKLEQAAEIKFGKLPKLEKTAAELENTWSHIPFEKRLLREEVTEEDIAQVVSRWSGIPVSKLLASEADKLIHLEQVLEERVVGQDEGVIVIAKAMRRNRSGLGSSKGPIGTFLFLGPTGVGKTETAKALAEYMMGSEEAIVRIDMGEYQEEHALARLIGAPPGYVGYDEGGQLTEAVRRKPYCVVLLDEMEKAHPNVANVLLQVMDDGRLTDGKGRVVDFKNTIIIMTSNLASETIRKLAQEKNTNQIRAEIEPVLQKTFKPEFLNRLSAIVIYKPLDREMIGQIVKIQISHLKNILSEKQIGLEVTEKAYGYLATKGFDPVFGARPLQRLIENEILDEISLLIIEDKIKSGQTVKVDLKKDQLKIEVS